MTSSVRKNCGLFPASIAVFFISSLEKHNEACYDTEEFEEIIKFLLI